MRGPHHLTAPSLLHAAFALLTITWALADTHPFSLIYHNEAHFAGFPANEGAWSWGDEILVSFMVTEFEQTETSHNQKSGAPRRIRFARSQDGGKTWTAESHDNVSLSAHARNPDLHRQEAPNLQRPRPLDHPIDFSDPDLAIKIRDDQFYLSTDRGRSWQGPHLFPDLGRGSLSSRTSYLVTGPKSCLFFFSAAQNKPKQAERSRSFVAETTDGGLTLSFVGWMGNDIAAGVDDKRVVYSTMPSVIRLENSHLLGTLRRRIGASNRWTDIVRSSDEGRTWTHLTTLERGVNNPVALVHLGGSKAAAIYGSRTEGSIGIMAQTTTDGGQTWSKPSLIRGQALNWDIGYCRAVRRSDGKIVVMYYFADAEHRQQHIASSLWLPPDLD